ncbi:hypothetical protein LEP1GSC055_1293 [Leptospira borgpetersenii str. Brem 307]|nr:hypothetical protein LEP1GSC055_1293 [Leptospira borgpetersenii str. Brem 307]
MFGESSESPIFHEVITFVKSFPNELFKMKHFHFLLAAIAIPNMISEKDWNSFSRI